jgi:ribosomal protein S2
MFCADFTRVHRPMRRNNSINYMYTNVIFTQLVLKLIIIVDTKIKDIGLWRRYASRIKVLMRVLVFFRTFKYVFKKPDVLCAANPTLYNTLIRDFTGSGIPCISLVDTTTNVRHITYPIPSNDDSIVLVLFFFKIFCNVIKLGNAAYYNKIIVSNGHIS